MVIPYLWYVSSQTAQHGLPRGPIHDTDIVFVKLGYGLGTANIPDHQNKEGPDGQLVERVKEAMEVGYRHLDGADCMIVKCPCLPLDDLTRC